MNRTQQAVTALVALAMVATIVLMPDRVRARDAVDASSIRPVGAVAATAKGELRR